MWLRTVQHARYIEARATSVGELLDTLRGKQFAGQTFTESPLVIARTRVPEVAGAARTELGWPAAIAGAAGVLALWRPRRRVAGLLAFSFLGCAGLLAMLGRVATEGIQLPGLMPCWLLAGAGLGLAWERAGAMAGRAIRTAALVAVALVCAAVPAAQGWQNLDFNNSRHDTALHGLLQGAVRFARRAHRVCVGGIHRQAHAEGRGGTRPAFRA